LYEKNNKISNAAKVISSIGVFSLVLAGSFLIEKVFNIDGMGYLGYTSILQRDYPVALGILVISSLLMLVGNIISDIIYAVVDPRIRFK
jgi:microcin C transport system permease protein